MLDMLSSVPKFWGVHLLPVSDFVNAHFAQFRRGYSRVIFV